jgi:hypothetical protein
MRVANNEPGFPNYRPPFNLELHYAYVWNCIFRRSIFNFGITCPHISMCNMQHANMPPVRCPASRITAYGMCSMHLHLPCTPLFSLLLTFLRALPGIEHTRVAAALEAALVLALVLVRSRAAS